MPVQTHPRPRKSVSALVRDLIEADTAILEAGRALYDSPCEFIPVSADDELAYFRAVHRFSTRGGSRDITESLLCGMEIQ